VPLGGVSSAVTKKRPLLSDSAKLGNVFLSFEGPGRQMLCT
jgi:hypothetical protein